MDYLAIIELVKTKYVKQCKTHVASDNWNAYLFMPTFGLITKIKSRICVGLYTLNLT